MRLFLAFGGAALALAAFGVSAAEPKDGSAVSGAGAANVIDVKSGETVYDRQGGTVGAVIRVGNDDAVVDTGMTKVTLGLDSFRRRDGKLVLPMDRAALEAAAGKVQAAGDGEILALLTPGASFYDCDGVAVGTIVSADAKQVVVEAGTLKAGLPLSAFVKGPEGARLSSTRADFLAKLEAQRITSTPQAKKAD